MPCPLVFSDDDLHHGVALGERIDNILAVVNLAEHSVFAVKMRLWSVTDKKLAAIRAGPRIRHR